ncbi:hypothetical protein ACU4GA_23160 [Methylobacterium oryzae CBMB20]
MAVDERVRGERGTDMRPTEPFIDLIRTVNRLTAPDVLVRLRALLAEGDDGTRTTRLRRRLEALAFRLEGEDQLDAVADTYDLIGAIATEDRERWALAAVNARLRDLCGRGRYAEAAALVSELRAGGDPAAIREGLATLLRPRLGRRVRTGTGSLCATLPAGFRAERR